MSTIREEVRKLADRLPDDADWKDVMYEVYVRQKIAEGEKAISEERLVSHDEVRSRFMIE
jgi:hypothetical protein